MAVAGPGGHPATFCGLVGFTRGWFGPRRTPLSCGAALVPCAKGFCHTISGNSRWSRHGHEVPDPLPRHARGRYATSELRFTTIRAYSPGAMHRHASRAQWHNRQARKKAVGVFESRAPGRHDTLCRLRLFIPPGISPGAGRVVGASLGGNLASNEGFHADGATFRMNRGARGRLWAVSRSFSGRSTLCETGQTGAFTCGYTADGRFYASFLSTLHKVYYHGFIIYKLLYITIPLTWYHQHSTDVAYTQDWRRGCRGRGPLRRSSRWACARV